MTVALSAHALSKKFRHYDNRRPHTFQQYISGGWRHMGRPEEFWALKDVAFDVAAGEMLGVIGHNGSGKSTLLKLLSGVMMPDKGRIERAAPVNGLLELNTGIHPDLSGRDNILINGVISGLSRRQALDRTEEIIDFAELQDFINEPVRTYSSGMKLRLGFAIAVHVDPKILLIDEVLAVGDLAFQQKCIDRILQFRKSGCAIVLISHDLQQVSKICDRILWLRQGNVAGYGDAASLANEYRIEMARRTRDSTPSDAPAVRLAPNILLQPGTNRFGSLDAQIGDVRLNGHDGTENTEIESGDPLEITFSVAAVTLEKYQLSVTISDADGLVCVDLGTGRLAANPPSVLGLRQLSLQMERLDLMPGEYFVSVGVYEHDWSYAYDFHHDVYRFRVCGQKSGKGIMNPPHTWLADAAKRPIGA